MSKSNLSKEEIDYLQDELEEKFGPELEKLKKQLDYDIKTRGSASKQTLSKRDALMAKILEEKKRTYDQN